jgi:integrase
MDGLWVFRITDEGGHQSLKNVQSKRQIPVHPTLIDLGILDYRQKVIQAGKPDLFYSINPDTDGRRSTAAGKWFGKFLSRIGVKGKGSLGATHRWRHTLTDALRRGGVEDYRIAQILGHKLDVAKMTNHYGRDLTLTMQQKYDFLSKADYPSVDFTLLR